MDRMELYKAGKTDEEIAEIEKIKPKTIQAWRQRRYLPTNVKRDETFDKKRAYQLWNDGLRDKEIGKILGCSDQVIQNWRLDEDMGANGYIYSWQTSLKPSEFAKIPEKYRNPKLVMSA